jgi:hypothetical protein
MIGIVIVVKALGFSALPGGTGQRRKSRPMQASLQCRANFFAEGVSKRPEMSSHYEKSAKAKTMKGNCYEKSKHPRL